MGSLNPIKKTQLAQQYDARDNKLHLNEIPIPEPQSHEILVKIASASLCHTDVMLFDSDHPGLILGKNPVTIGHEAIGYVVSTGRTDVASKFKKGDLVGFICAAECCFECEPCRKVHNAWCVTGKTKLQGFTIDGYFQEYAVVDARTAMVLPPELDPKTSAPLFCAGTTAYHAIEDCELKPGQWIAVIGCGGLGHLGVQYAKAMDLKVIAVDIADRALELAKACGADHIFNSLTDKNWQKKILKLTGAGVDAAANFTSSKESYADTPPIIRPGLGLLMVVGIPQEPIKLNALDIAMGRYRVKGSNNGTCYNMRPAIEFTAKHGIKAHLDLFKFEDVPKMVELMKSHKARGRMGVVFDGGPLYRGKFRRLSRL